MRIRPESVAIGIVAMATLVLELVLIRVFDVILGANLGYMVITCALFAFGLAGIYVALRPQPPGRDPTTTLSVTIALFALSVLALRPVVNALPIDPGELMLAPLTQMLAFGGLYLSLVVVFFLSGLVFARLFSLLAARIQSLYMWDLTGAAVGGVAPAFLIGILGPGRLLVVAGGLTLLAAAVLAPRRRVATALAAAGAAVALVAVAGSPEDYEFTERRDRRGLEAAYERGAVEVTRWDPISKIAVMRERVPVETAGGRIVEADRRLVVYDGGTQITYFIPFDGDYARLRHAIDRREPGVLVRHFPRQRAMLAAHYLRRDTGTRVLVIGSAGGQEIKAALMYGAAHVDGIDLVQAVIDLGRTRYDAYLGGTFNDPRVSVRFGEGRSFLRASSERYDIIQIFSNHTSSSIAAGTGAMDPTYLQTAEAYVEYFEHLGPDGILQVNHFAYPRMITSAALAWRWLGRRDFQRHVAVFERPDAVDNTPTMLIKMSPWTEGELAELREFLGSPGPGEHTARLVEDPIDPAASFLSPAFYGGAFPERLAELIPYRIIPTTDDKPYFAFLRKQPGELEPDPSRFVNHSTAGLLNTQLLDGVVPRDLAHLLISGAVSIVFVLLFVVVPLRFATTGTARWPRKGATLGYFACLGAGFIVIELIFIQVFMKLIGYPLYSFSAVLFTLLLAAGLGSGLSERLGFHVGGRWVWPFVGILAYGALFTALYPHVFGWFLAAPLPARLAAAAVLIFPIGLFLGMPFPLGIRTIAGHPPGTVAWAWGLNGAFTVVGGLASVLVSVLLGFRLTLVLALGVYVLAAVLLQRMRAPAS